MDFQNVNPELFVLVAELLGNVVANELPFNVQNAVGNWLQLVGQAIVTYNAQQQYYQQGPGRYFTPDSFNVDNPFCQKDSETAQAGTTTSDESTKTDEILPKTSRSTEDESMMSFETKQVVELQQTLETLMKRLDQLEEEIQQLKSTNE